MSSMSSGTRTQALPAAYHWALYRYRQQYMGRSLFKLGKVRLDSSRLDWCYINSGQYLPISLNSALLLPLTAWVIGRYQFRYNQILNLFWFLRGHFVNLLNFIVYVCEQTMTPVNLLKQEVKIGYHINRSWKTYKHYVNIWIMIQLYIKFISSNIDWSILS